MPRIPSSGGPTDRRLLAAGAIAGLAVGAAVSGRLRQTRPVAPGTLSDAGDQGFIDWDAVRSLAVRMNQQEPLLADERERLDVYYRSLVDQCFPIVQAYTGIQLSGTSERTFTFDRVDWVGANIEAFKHLLQPIEDMVARQRAKGNTSFSGVNRRIASAEVGLLLGYLARRVLGQYDLALLGREPVEGGKLYYVEPNIRQIEATLGLPRNDFRMWLALHETTHAFEFEGNPWVPRYFNGLLNRYLGTVEHDARLLTSGITGLRTLVGRTRSRDANSSWVEAVMTQEQRDIFGQLQALMCMVEGYSNHVMNAVGRDLLPTYDTISRRFEQRKSRRSPADELFGRITGLKLKMEQYRLGEEFIDAVVAARSHDVARRVWDGPEFLPTMGEIRNPSAWLTRIDQMDGKAAVLTAGSPG
ncbi:MAG: hypothetical protein AVDCRST_MAG33-2064 [uncultured Thermomicrobiales bacterium]|uniref:Zinc-dependent metalloprotease n=1 Tax=uncultured Thermomicrobiales bacterium TaxID=1645740 RepID=A0A6J4V5L7_9BACT|nr:MAG: hypothetical protein AVDCRST_MAG33-2064 [uncultured Thermomicrobiales bacterium]